MTGTDDRQRAREIAEGLNKSFFAHGDAVSRTRARDLQLKVAKDEPGLEKLIWDAYLGLENHMAFRSPFNLFQHFLANADRRAITPVAPIVLPPNAPEKVVQHVWDQVIKAAVQNQPVEVGYEIVHAVIESRRRASEYRECGAVTAVRITGEVQLNRTVTSDSWISVDHDFGEADDTRK